MPTREFKAKTACFHLQDPTRILDPWLDPAEVGSAPFPPDQATIFVVGMNHPQLVELWMVSGIGFPWVSHTHF